MTSGVPQVSYSDSDGGNTTSEQTEQAAEEAIPVAWQKVLFGSPGFKTGQI